MAKTKKNRAGLSEKIANKTQKAAMTKLNPFDIRFVKSKQKILGRKEKIDVGKPGIARAKAIQKVMHKPIPNPNDIPYNMHPLQYCRYSRLKCI